MTRLGASLIIGFALLFMQSYIVMLLNDYASIRFTYAPGIVAVWLLNTMMTFSLLTQLKPWLSKATKQPYSS